MELKDFYALDHSEGPLYEGKDKYRSVRLTRTSLGDLAVPEGIVAVADGLILDSPVEIPTPADKGEIWLTVADVSPAQDGSHLRTAYLSMIFSDQFPTAVEPALDTDGDSDFAIPVDAGTVAFYSLAQFNEIEESDDFDSDEFFDDLLTELEEVEAKGQKGFIRYFHEEGLPGGIALSSSGWGDGAYAVYQTVDSAGNVLGLHVDFGVVGILED